MKETLLLLLLALGGGAAPAASPGLGLAQPAMPVTGVWRGAWTPRGGTAVPVEAVLASDTKAGTLVALVVAGVGRGRRTARLSGRLLDNGATLVLPTGGAVRLSADGASRLIGEVTGAGRADIVPGDGAVELRRVRR
jgi:hypothetical protein